MVLPGYRRGRRAARAVRRENARRAREARKKSTLTITPSTTPPSTASLSSSLIIATPETSEIRRQISVVGLPCQRCLRQLRGPRNDNFMEALTCIHTVGGKCSRCARLKRAPHDCIACPPEQASLARSVVAAATSESEGLASLVKNLDLAMKRKQKTAINHQTRPAVTPDRNDALELDMSTRIKESSAVTERWHYIGDLFTSRRDLHLESRSPFDQFSLQPTQHQFNRRHGAVLTSNTRSPKSHISFATRQQVRAAIHQVRNITDELHALGSQLDGILEKLGPAL